MNTLQERINYAESVIRRGGNTSRKFDGCFEEGDGDIVVKALVSKADKRVGKLATNLSRYVCEHSINRARSVLNPN